MLAVIVRNFVKEENEEAFLVVAKGHRDATRANDKGCIVFEISEPEGGEVTFIEIWDSKENLEKHNQAGQEREHVAKLNSLRYAKDIEILSLI